MKKINRFLIVILSLISFLSQAQSYFQQEVNTKINVTLDDKTHTLTGNIEIEYTNNSPNELTFIYFHLWPNAYQYESALAKQLLENRNVKMHYAKKSQLGYIKDLDFKANGQALSWEYDKEHRDIALVRLAKPLKSKETITIATPFVVKIPASFSRLGHVHTSYQITQWFPKPAVYDQFGWHPMSYLNQGEFYSEFGAYDVSITLPKNYVVGATGVLQTEREKAFLQEKIEWTNQQIQKDSFKIKPYPASSEEMKTIRYTAENVHDFAWFADKRFYVQKGVANLPSGKKVETYVMFPDREAKLWKKAIEYLNRSVTYYSKRIGEYPYPQVTVVQSALSAGGGMEYPMITVIGSTGNAQTLDRVIAHEVGHNWFYGILATNEREHPWMDEGINSFYEMSYMAEYYEDANEMIRFVPKRFRRMLEINEETKFEQVAYTLQASRNKHQPMTTSSVDFSFMNYGVAAYMTTALSFKYLEEYLGKDAFDKTMQLYFDNWKFKHPFPNALRGIFERMHGSQDWFFDDLLGTKKLIDYALERVDNTGNEAQITVKNRGEIVAPFSISSLKAGKIVQTKWYQGITGAKTITFGGEAADEYVIDAEAVMPDINRANNRQSVPLKLKFLGALESGDNKQLYYLPLLSYNRYDGVMAGLAFYNSLLRSKRFEFALAPMFGFSSTDVVGLADLKYHFFPKKHGTTFQRLTLGVNVKTFHNAKNEELDFNTRYVRYYPKLTFEWKKTPRSTTTQFFDVGVKYLTQQRSTFDTSRTFVGLVTGDRTIYEANYTLKNDRILFPYKVKLGLQGEGYNDAFGAPESYVKASLEATYKMPYQKNRKSFDVRLFVGAFLHNTDKNFGPFPFALVGQNYADYYFDDYFIGRTEQEGIWQQQVSLSQGGFKTPVLRSAQNGRSNSFVMALNMKVDLPMRLPLNLPLKPYLDVGYFKETAPAVTDPTEFFYNAGVMLDIGDGILGIYLPFWASDELQTNGGFRERIGFSLDLAKLDLLESIRNLRF